MKKLIFIFILFYSSFLYSKIYIIKTFKFDNQEISIVCIDGYKYMIVNGHYVSDNFPATIIQMYENESKFSNLPLLAKCNDKDK